MAGLNTKISIYWLWLTIAFTGMGLVFQRDYSDDISKQWPTILLYHTLAALLVAIPGAVMHTVSRHRRGLVEPVVFSLRQVLVGTGIVALVFGLLKSCSAPSQLYVAALLANFGWAVTLILAAMLLKVVPSVLVIPEIADLPAERKEAILVAAVHSKEYQTYEQAHQFRPFIASVVVGTIPLAVGPAFEEGSVAGVDWLLIDLVAILIGLAIGRFSKHVKTGVVIGMVSMNLIGWLRGVAMGNLSGALIGALATAVSYQVIRTVGTMLYVRGQVRLLRSLVREQLMDGNRV
jgi:hypothetical protein